jgi:hypothetical protein
MRRKCFSVSSQAEVTQRSAMSASANAPWGREYAEQCALARLAPCPAIYGIEKGDDRTKGNSPGAKVEHSMDNSEKNRQPRQR